MEIPAAFLRSADPIPIEVDGVTLVIRELTPEEFTELSTRHVVMKDGKPSGMRAAFNNALIEMSVVDPPIPDANVLKPGVAGKIALRIQETLGILPDEVKNG